MKRFLAIACSGFLFVLTCLGQDSIFVDPNLRQLIEKAMTANSDVRTALLNVEQAQALMKKAKLSYMPGISLTPSGSISKSQGQFVAKTYTMPIAMEWELSLRGRKKYERKIAEAQWLQTQEQLRYLQVLLSAEVSNSYYTLIMLDRQLEISRQSIANQEASLQALQALFEVGKMNQMAVSQAEATLYETQISLIELQLQQNKVISALSLLINETPDAIVRSSWQQVLPLGLNPNVHVALYELSSRPDVRSAEYELMAACSNVDVARSAYYPALHISANCGWTNNVEEIINPATLLFNLVASLVQPIFARGTIKMQNKVAKTQLEQAEIEFEKALLTAGTELKDALDECVACHRKQEVRMHQVESSEAAYLNSKVLLEHSESVNYLEVLTAQNALLSAQMQQCADWMEQQQSLINLYKALCPITSVNE